MRERAEVVERLDDLNEEDRKLVMSDPKVRARAEQLLKEVREGRGPRKAGMSAAELLDLAREQR